MLSIPSYLIDTCFAFTDKGWYPLHMLAMETSPNRINVIVTVANVKMMPHHFPFDVMKSQELKKRTLWERVKQFFLKLIGKTDIESRPVDPAKPEFTVEFMPLEDLLDDLANSKARAVEIASYADVSSQLWMGSPFEDDPRFAQMYEGFHNQLMAAAALGVNWVVVESEYINQAFYHRDNFRKHVEAVVRSRYAFFCKSVCFDLNHAISYLPANMQEHARLVLGYEPISPAAEAGLLAYCSRVTENGPKDQHIHTEGVTESFWKMLKEYQELLKPEVTTAKTIVQNHSGKGDNIVKLDNTYKVRK
jgi:hypothetical protein